MDKKIDPRRLKFGTKIENGDNGDRNELWVKDHRPTDFCTDVKEVEHPPLEKTA